MKEREKEGHYLCPSSDLDSGHKAHSALLPCLKYVSFTLRRSTASEGGGGHSLVTPLEDFKTKGRIMRYD